MLIASNQNAHPLKCLARDFCKSSDKIEPFFPHPVTDLIDIHQRIISPTDGPRSHFLPVSSTYLRACYKRFGALGILLGFDRLMRENSEKWVYRCTEIDNHLIKCDLPPEKSEFICRVTK